MTPTHTARRSRRLRRTLVAALIASVAVTAGAVPAGGAGDLSAHVIDLPGLTAFDVAAVVATGDDRHLVVVRSLGGVTSIVALVGGRLDRSYGTDGRAGLGEPLGDALDAARAPDGDLAVLLSGSGSSTIALVTPTGDLDEGFGVGGILRLSFAARAIAFGADGHLYAAGTVIAAGAARPAVGAFTASGGPDSGFDPTSALVALEQAGVRQLTDVAVDNDRIGVVGPAEPRLSGIAASVLDPSGRPSGVVAWSWGRTAIQFDDLVSPQARFDGRGRLAVLASVRSRGAGAFYVALARLTAGALDLAFDGDGRLVVRSPRGRNRRAGELIARADGTLVVLGDERAWALRRERGDRRTLTRVLPAGEPSTPYAGAERAGRITMAAANSDGLRIVRGRLSLPRSAP